MLKTICFLIFFCVITSHSFSQEKSLYQRLGGYDGITAVVNDFLEQCGQDPAINVFFKGHSEDSMKKTKQLIVEFFCNQTDGPCEYIGRDMKTAHKGLGITEEVWNKSAGYLKNSLTKYNVGQKEQDELFAALVPLKSEIVEK